MIAKTQHAIGLQLEKGIELLIHVGANTRDFSALGVHLHVYDQKEVKAGTKLLSFNQEYFQAIELQIPIVVLNSFLYKVTTIKTGTFVLRNNSVLMDVA